jgi:HlyD family secretion protein
MKPPIRNLPLLAATLLTALAAASAGCRRDGSATATFETVAANTGPLRQRVTASGTLGALVSVDVGAQVSGKVIALHADWNSPVRKGQVVAEIDPTLYRAQLNQAEGELANARATLTLKRQNLARKTALLPVKAVSQFDVDVASAEVAQAEAQLSIREAHVESARANVEFCRITAPVDGIVISRRVDPGQTVIAAMTAPLLFNIAQDITRMNINASVSEADIGLVAVGQEVEFTVEAYPDETFKGVVVQVRKSPVSSQNVVTYETLITVENPGERLFPGMTADVAILVAQTPDSTKVPNAALRYSPPQEVEMEQDNPKGLLRNQRLLYIPGSQPGRLRPVVVRIGISDGVETEILGGVAAGTPVVTATRSVPTGKAGLTPPTPPPAP